MKYLLFVFTILLFSGCSKTDNDKAAQLVEEWLKKNVNDLSGLEIVSINDIELDSVLSYEDEPEYLTKLDEITLLYKHATKAIDEDQVNLAKEFEKKAIEGEKEIEKKKNDFKPYCRGKITTVKYRSKNEFGALSLKEKTFHFDNDITKIIYPE